jgi:hypothetical protein
VNLRSAFSPHSDGAEWWSVGGVLMQIIVGSKAERIERGLFWHAGHFPPAARIGHQTVEHFCATPFDAQPSTKDVLK